jgi:uncharacterized protein YydD (DUF2326 family)
MYQDKPSLIAAAKSVLLNEENPNEINEGIFQTIIGRLAGNFISADATAKNWHEGAMETLDQYKRKVTTDQYNEMKQAMNTVRDEIAKMRSGSVAMAFVLNQAKVNKRVEAVLSSRKK